MANLLWGKIYYQDIFAGILRQDAGFGSSFIYDESYLDAKQPAIAYSLPLQKDPHEFQTELPPFFDNLVAEGWLEEAQSRVLGKRISSRFELLLAFGFDCAGAVSVIDPNPEKFSTSLANLDDPKEVALLTSRASLSGIQPKLAVKQKNGIYYPTHNKELSTHIAKFHSRNHFDLVKNEYLTSLAFKTLLPTDDFVEMHLGKIDGFDEEALIIKRFDRTPDRRIHFEEFNQLFNQPAINKYSSSYKNMADFIRTTPDCLPIEIFRLYKRIIAGTILGNTDMHLKNFAMFHTARGLRLTPTYDQVAAYLYGYKQIALGFCGIENLPIQNLTLKNIKDLGIEFGLNNQTIDIAIDELKTNMEKTKQVILEANFCSNLLRESIARLLENSWL